MSVLCDQCVQQGKSIIAIGWNLDATVNLPVPKQVQAENE
jgi:hypothetical protein